MTRRPGKPSKRSLGRLSASLPTPKGGLYPRPRGLESVISQNKALLSKKQKIESAISKEIKNIRKSSVLNMVESGMISKALDIQFGEVLRVSLESLDKGYDKILIKIDE